MYNIFILISVVVSVQKLHITFILPLRVVTYFQQICVKVYFFSHLVKFLRIIVNINFLLFCIAAVKLHTRGAKKCLDLNRLVPTAE